MSQAGSLTVLCVATYEKGQEFLRECKRQGCRVLLLTTDTLRDADWPREAIDETFYMPREIGREDLLKGVSHVGRTHRIDRIVALDDFDVETAALLREHLRVTRNGRDDRPLLPRQARGADEGAQLRHPGPRLRAHGERRRDQVVRGPDAAALDPEAALAGRRDRHEEDRAGRGPVAGPRRPGRSPFPSTSSSGSWPATSFTSTPSSGRRRSCSRRCTSTRPASVPGGAWRRHLHDDIRPEARPGVGRTRAHQSRCPHDVRHHARRHPHRVHPERGRRPVPLPRDLGPRRRCVHRRPGRGRKRTQPLARVGQAGDRRRGGHLPGASADGPLRRTGPDAGEAAVARSSGYTDPEIVYRVAKANHAGLIVASNDEARVRTLLNQYSVRFQQDFFAFVPAPERPPA